MSEQKKKNMAVWDAVARPPVAALKTIKGGRLTGKSDINPQWRVQAMTEQFGPCGVGWKFSIDHLWTEPGVDGVVFAFARVSVHVRLEDGAWSDAVPGIGGHKLVEPEKGGLYNNDEAFKMATTDALGTALKMFGVAADIYLGTFDGSKYLTPPAEEIRDNQERQKQLTQDAYKTGSAILNAAADKGEESLKLAWQALTEAMRTACKDVKESLKEKAKAVDGQKRTNHASSC